MPNSAVRTRPQNIFRGRVGPKGSALNAKVPFDFWELFITPEMIELLVEKTKLFVLCVTCQDSATNDDGSE